MCLLMCMGLFSCEKENGENLSDQEIQELLTGKWKRTMMRGQENPTNYGMIVTFTDSKTGYASVSQENGDFWLNKEPFTYAVKDGVLSFTFKDYPQITNTLNIKSITADKVTGTENYSGDRQMEVEYEPVKVDYAKAILGLWEGASMDGPETYGDWHHRWQYNADGTFIYFIKDANGKWMPDPSNAWNEYNVDGDWLATIWQNDSTVYRERWTIDSCDENEMKWSAFRRNFKTKEEFHATFTMKRVK